METEKRLAICFALSMLIIILFSWYNNKNMPQKSKPQRRTSTVQEVTPTPQKKVPDVDSFVDVPKEEKEQSPKPEEGDWSWLATAEEGQKTGAVLVESDLYQIEFSTRGAIPISWKLLEYDKLYKDPRYLQLVQKTGSPYERQLAQLELSFYKEHQDQEFQPINAIDPTFPNRKAGLIFKWGKNYSDEIILYQCEHDSLNITKATELTFSFTGNGIKLEKVFRFYPDSYHIDMQVRIINETDRALTFEEENYYDVAWFGGFGFPSMRSDAVNNAYTELDGSVSIQPTDSLLSELQKNQFELMPDYNMPILPVTEKKVDWAGVGQKYFLAAVVPLTPTNFAFKGISSPSGEADYVRKPLAGVRIPMQKIIPGATHTDKFKLFVGPMEDDWLRKADAKLTNARQIFLRSFVGPITRLMLYLLQGVYKIVPNYGVAIILLTLLIKIFMLPLYQKQMASMKKMQALQPQINALKEKYKDDPQKMQKEQMELFRKHKVNPLGGCLTMLPTIPIFIALYATFGMALELRGAPFFGWIHDLSVPDSAFYIPIAGFIFTVNILPLAYAVLMLASTSMQKIEGPNATMMKIFPLMFVFFFWRIASGVILYFVISIFIDLVQRLIMEKFSAEPSPVVSKKK